MKLVLAATALALLFSQASASLEPRATRKTLSISFADYKATQTYANFLNSKGLYVSDYPVASTPLSHTFQKENVKITGGALRMKVTGQSGRKDVKSAEVVTIAHNMLYGKITTRAKSSPVPGVCHGFFFYKDDNAEVDIELLTSYYWKGYQNGAVKPGLELTNQPLKAGGKSTNVAIPYTFDPTEAYHDYTIEWTSKFTKFYVDGKLIRYFTSNVPRTPMSFIWNSWSSGDPYWSAGPPKQDAYLYIEKISGYYYEG